MQVEDRNCNCPAENANTSANACCNTQETMNICCNSQETMNDNMSCACKRQMREEMLQEIKCLRFAVIDISLYLDTHADDSKALCLHRKYCKELKELTDKYQKVFGPLTIEYPCNKWRWLEEPWPWEGGVQ